MTQGSLIDPVTKLDIKDLLKPSPSPSPIQRHRPLAYSRSLSVPNVYPQRHPIASPSSSSVTSSYSASTAPSYTFIQHTSQDSGKLSTQPVNQFGTAPTVCHENQTFEPSADSSTSNKRPFPTEEEPVRTKAKRLSKWSPAEDTKIIYLRGSKGIKWDDISKELPGRSSIACRLHYQNYLEKKCEWDEEKRNKLARVYDRSVLHTSIHPFLELK